MYTVRNKPGFVKLCGHSFILLDGVERAFRITTASQYYPSWGDYDCWILRRALATS